MIHKLQEQEDWKDEFHYEYGNLPDYPSDIPPTTYDRYLRIIYTLVVNKPIEVDEVCKMKRE